MRELGLALLRLSSRAKRGTPTRPKMCAGIRGSLASLGMTIFRVEQEGSPGWTGGVARPHIGLLRVYNFLCRWICLGCLLLVGWQPRHHRPQLLSYLFNRMLRRLLA